MPYTVTNSRGTDVATVLDGTVNNTSSSLKLIGQGKANYGEVLNEDFWALMENFASPTPPTAPVRGQLWFDTTTNALKVKIDEAGVTNTWEELGGSVNSDTILPGSGDIGELFWHTSEGALYIWDGSTWLKLFPSRKIQNSTDTTSVEIDAVQQIARVITNTTTSAEFGAADTKFFKQIRANLLANPTFSGSQVWDCNSQQVLSVTLTGNSTITPSNFKSGGKYTLVIKQDAVGGRTFSFGGGAWFWSSGVPPIISSAANSLAVFEFVSDGSLMILTSSQGGSAAGNNPVGTVLSFAGATPPSNWFVCDGQAISRTTYPDLFAAISTTYGAGNGSTTFNIPDARGRTILGAGQGTGLTNRALGVIGGTETQALTTAQLPSHAHNINHTHTGTAASAGDHTHNVNGPVRFTSDNNGNSRFQSTGTSGSDYSSVATPITAQTAGAHTHTLTIDAANVNSASTGSGEAHNNMQPYIAMNYIIYAGTPAS